MSANDLFEKLNFKPENLNNIKDKATQMQNQMAKMQEMLNTIAVEGSAGIENYNVKITMNGRHEAVKVLIDSQLMTQPINVLCDLVASAITDASHKAEHAIQNNMMNMFKNINLPQ